MKKGLFGFIILLGLLTLSMNMAYATDSINIVINGNAVTFSEDTGFPYVDENNRTMVPLRVTMETAGAVVDWDSATQTVLIQTPNAGILVPINENYILANNSQIQIDSTAKIVNGRTYLPIRAVLEAAGYSVGWDAATQTILADKNSGNTAFQDVLEVRDMMNKYWVYSNGKWQREGDRLVDQAAINDVLTKADESFNWDTLNWCSERDLERYDVSFSSGSWVNGGFDINAWSFKYSGLTGISEYLVSDITDDFINAQNAEVTFNGIRMKKENGNIFFYKEDLKNLGIL